MRNERGHVNGDGSVRRWAALLVVSLLAGLGAACDLGFMGTGAGDAYGTLTLSERTALVPDGRLPSGQLKFTAEAGSVDAPAGVPVIALRTNDNVVVQLVGWTAAESNTCVRPGGFCVLRPDVPMLVLFDFSATDVLAYTAVSGTAFIESTDPFVVRLERAVMGPHPSFAGSAARGGFRLDGTLRNRPR